MTRKTAPQRPLAVVGEINNFAASFAEMLDPGELLASIISVDEVTTSDLTIDNEVVSTAALVIFGTSVPIGMAVQFNVAGHLVANQPYTVRITIWTDSTPAQRKVRDLIFLVEA